MRTKIMHLIYKSSDAHKWNKYPYIMHAGMLSRFSCVQLCATP